MKMEKNKKKKGIRNYIRLFSITMATLIVFSYFTGWKHIMLGILLYLLGTVSGWTR
jgi:hypothetical protein